MCGIVGMISDEPVNQRLYDALLLLQHRGQDAAGISTVDNLTINTYKLMGMVANVFKTRNMRDLTGNMGVGHVRYPTQGNSGSNAETQPFYVNAPWGIVFAHNGNLTNTEAVKRDLYEQDHRHINTHSDSEVLLNVLANEIQKATGGNSHFTTEAMFEAVRNLHRVVRGSYACVAAIAGKGLLAFRDPYGIRPLTIGSRVLADGSKEYVISSESVVTEGLEFEIERDVRPGEAIFISKDRQFFSQMCCEGKTFSPCAFEYVYFARPDSVIDGISVYDARLKLGENLAAEVRKTINVDDVDVVMPIPDSSRPSAQQLATALNKPYREGLIKNRYVGRTFIMPGQETRKKSVRQKLNAMPSEFRGKNVLLVDDSIVRGTTMGQIIRMVRQAGANKVFVASAAPRVMFPNVYGIDMATRAELICGRGESGEEVARIIGADGVIYQTLDGLRDALSSLNPEIPNFDCSCFDGVYVTGDIDEEYLRTLEASRGKTVRETDEDA